MKTRKTVLIGLVAGILIIGIASAALLEYYGMITGTVGVAQSVLVDGGNYLQENIYGKNIIAGSTVCSSGHTLYNRAEVPATVGLNTNYDPDGVGITMTYLKEIEYSFAETVTVSDGTVGVLEVTVAEDGDWMVWTFDFPVEQFIGDGNLNVGLIIATDGEGKGPAFQIHNNDGTDSRYAWGTWLYSPWGPTIDDGWKGWHSSDTNIPVTELDWVEATGNRNVPHEGGVMQIKIKKSELGTCDFHWAASPTVGSGFYAPAYDVTMQIPTAFGWSTPIVDMTVPNYVHAELVEELPDEFTLQPGEVLDFIIRTHFSVALIPKDYTITTTVVPITP